MPKKNPHRDFAASINVRLPAVDLQNLKSISERLDLETSEVARRALREGLKAFEDARLPGGTQE